MPRMAIPAVRKATSGATTAGTISFESRPLPFTAENPTAAMTAPTSPPISACDELEGSPKYQVIRFQAMAPIRAAKTTVVETA